MEPACYNQTNAKGVVGGHVLRIMRPGNLAVYGRYVQMVHIFIMLFNSTEYAADMC